MNLKRHSLYCRVAACLALSLTSGCASTTVIRSNPSEVDLYIDGRLVGKTPYRYTDMKISGSYTNLQMKKEGYEDLNTILARNEQIEAGALVGAILFGLIPLLWVQGYSPIHSYELTPIQTRASATPELKRQQEQASEETEPAVERANPEKESGGSRSTPKRSKRVRPAPTLPTPPPFP